MRFATIKTTEQQAVLTLHRARELLVKQQTMLANLIWALLTRGEVYRAPQQQAA